MGASGGGGGGGGGKENRRARREREKWARLQRGESAAASAAARMLAESGRTLPEPRVIPAVHDKPGLKPRQKTFESLHSQAAEIREKREKLAKEKEAQEVSMAKVKGLPERGPAQPAPQRQHGAPRRPGEEGEQPPDWPGPRGGGHHQDRPRRLRHRPGPAAEEVGQGEAGCGEGGEDGRRRPDGGGGGGSGGGGGGRGSREAQAQKEVAEARAEKAQATTESDGGGGGSKDNQVSPGGRDDENIDRFWEEEDKEEARQVVVVG